MRFFNLKHAALLALERQVFRTVKAVIVNSRIVAEEIARWHDFPVERVRVVPNGIGARYASDVPRGGPAAPRSSRKARFAFFLWPPARIQEGAAICDRGR